MAYSHTVVGIFDSDFAAQDAVDALIDKGFDRSEIDIRNRRDVDGASVREGKVSAYHADHKEESGLTSFFRSIFGGNDEDAEKHYRVAVEGGAVVTVYAKTSEEAMRVADILDDNGAIDVDKRDSRYRSSMADTGKSAASVDASQQKTSSTQKDYNNPIVTRHESEYARSRNMDRQMDEDFRELPRLEERSGPGIGTEPTAGKRSRSRINQWGGEASSRLREDRDSETKIGW